MTVLFAGSIACIAILLLLAGRLLRRSSGTPAKRPESRGGSEVEKSGTLSCSMGRGRLSASVMRLAGDLGGRVPPAPKAKLARDLQERAHLSGYSTEQLLGVRLILTVALPAGALLLLRFSLAAAALALPLSLAGYLLPRLLAARGRGRYLSNAREALPATVDLLYTYMLGGRNMDTALRSAAPLAREPLKSALEIAVNEVSLGAPREECFRRLKERVPLEEFESLLSLIVESEKRGHPPAVALEVFSRELRLRRRDRLRVAAARAPLEMLAPLVFLVLPASVILTVGPTFLATLKKVF